MNDNVISFEENLQHKVQELICIRCKWRGIVVSPVGLWLKDSQCPKCHKEGYLIQTGLDLDEKKEWQNYV